MKKIKLFIGMLMLSSCLQAGEYMKTVDYVDLNRFMKKWYVIAGRFTFLEKGAHNSIEEYSFNSEKNRIDINFYFNMNAFDGRLRKIPQKAWIENKETNAHWKVSPFWPIKFDYLVIALAADYSWTAIGVPNQKYLWIMSENWNMPEELLGSILKEIGEKGYSIENIERIPHKY